MIAFKPATLVEAPEMKDLETMQTSSPQQGHGEVAPEQVKARVQFADRLRRLWIEMNESMSQGGHSRVRVDPEMVDDIRAAEVLARREWRPIATANKGPDRKAILGWFPDIQCSFSIFWDKHDERWTYFGGHGSVVSEPTHWMPLPDGPLSHSDDRVRDGDNGAGA